MASSGWIFSAWAFFLCGYAAGLHKQPSSEGGTTRNCSSDPPYLPPTVTNTSHQLSALRQQMRNINVSAYIIPANDAHMSEYIAEPDKRREWMTGFAGSAGTAVVTMTKAALWTDSRYWTEAERQMDCNWELQRTPWIGSIVEWLLTEIPAGERIGLDPFLFSINNWNSYSEPIKSSGRILSSITTNLVDMVWSTRPSPPNNEIYQLKEEFTGSPWQEKVSSIRNQMIQHSQSPTAVLLSALDESAWLFNLRSKDIPYNPFFYSYTLLSHDFIRLFVNVSRITPEVQKYLNTNCTESLCVQLIDYNQVQENVRNYTEGNVKIWIGTEYTTYGLYEVIPKEKLLADNYSPVMKAKAVKNQKEQELMRKSHFIVDGEEIKIVDNFNLLGSTINKKKNNKQQPRNPMMHCSWQNGYEGPRQVSQEQRCLSPYKDSTCSSHGIFNNVI